MNDLVTKTEWRMLYDKVDELHRDFKAHTIAETEERVAVARNLAVLNFKSGIWGLMGGVLAAISVAVFGKH